MFVTNKKPPKPQGPAVKFLPSPALSGAGSKGIISAVVLERHPLSSYVLALHISTAVMAVKPRREARFGLLGRLWRSILPAESYPIIRERLSGG